VGRRRGSGGSAQQDGGPADDLKVISEHREFGLGLISLL
jgi:hypothetical protein